MTTTFKVKQVLNHLVLPALLLIMALGSCKKNDGIIEPGHHAASYNAEVLDKWMNMQVRLMRNATGIPNHGFARHFAYSGIAAVESLAPGLPGNAQWRSKWNGLTGLPVSSHPKDYYYPANVNAAMAAINRSMFPNASPADKGAIDSLEIALKQDFLVTQTPEKIELSVQFGRSVAAAVYNWSETDGYKMANSPYTVPTGPGLWKPTAPAYAAPATPYWGNNRTVISGSTTGTQPAAPTSYSVDPNSAFYHMVKQVYDLSQNLNDGQKAMAAFWKDIPGVSSPGHWLSILRQVISKHEVSLDVAALSYALTGSAINDALITCFQTKYHFNLVRPITYIREVMGHETWAAYIPTPAHPEYVSAHASLSAAAGAVLEEIFGNAGQFTDHTYDYLGFTARTYTSYAAIAEEAGLSRLYAGIHYMPSITAGLEQGRKVADNIFSNRK
jgi:hypothetical protein